MTLPTASLDQVAEVAAGGGAPQDPSAFSTNGTPFVRAGSLRALLGGVSEEALEHLTDEVAARHGLRKFPLGTVVFAKSGMSATKGHVYRLRHDAFVVNHLAALIPNHRLHPAFLEHTLRVFSPTRLIQDAAYPSIRLSDIAAMEIPVPPLPEQRRIAKILDGADALRAKRRAALTQLDTLTQAIFNEMLGNGVDGTSRFPAVTLEDVASLLSGFAWKSDRFSKQPDGLPVVRIQNVDAVMDVDFVYWPDAYDKRFLVRRNDLLLTMSGSFRVALWVGPDALLNQRIARVDPKPGNDRCWLLYALRNALGSIEAMGRYALVNNVAMSDLRQLVLARPPLALQQSFARRVAAIENLKAAHRASLAEMDALFASLQHRAFRGEI